MNTPFENVIQTSAKLVADEMDAQILRFFGSVEAVRRYAQDYVIEHKPVAVETYNDQTSFDNNTFYLRMETRVIIRLKTKEEREAENRD